MLRSRSRSPASAARSCSPGSTSSISPSSNSTRSSWRSRAPASSASRSSSARASLRRPRPRRRPRAVGLRRAAGRIEDLQLGGREHQAAVLVLAVEREQAARQLAQLADGDRATAEIGPRATVGADAARQHKLAGVHRKMLAAQAFGELEHTLDVGLRRTRPDDPRARPPAEQEVQRMGQDRLAGAGLAGDHVEAADQLEAGLLDQQNPGRTARAACGRSTSDRGRNPRSSRGGARCTAPGHAHRERAASARGARTSRAGVYRSSTPPSEPAWPRRARSARAPPAGGDLADRPAVDGNGERLARAVLQREDVIG